MATAAMISQVTEAVWDTVQAWQTRPLDALYPIVYLDAIVVKIRQDNRVINKTVHVALGVNLDGRKEVLGLSLAASEGAKFWLLVLTELQNRGVKDLFIACVDGLTDFPEAIQSVYPNTQVQRCIVHLMRNALNYLSYRDLKRIYRAVTVTEAEQPWTVSVNAGTTNIPPSVPCGCVIGKHIITLFDDPEEIRRVIYTTHAIESLNSVICKATNQRRLFPTDRSALKVVYLAIEQAARKWTMPIADWKLALNRFAILFENRMPLK